MTMYIYSHDSRRGLVRQLARRLGIHCVDAERRPRMRAVQLVNWGNSTPPRWDNRVVWALNTPEAVSTMAHKIRTFQALVAANVPCLEWTTDRGIAQTWFQADGSLYVRQVLTGHSAEGLSYIENTPGATVPAAPLYTRNYGTPFKEYRLHVVNGVVIDATIKRRMNETTLTEREQDVPEERQRLQIRTYGNGWVFTRADITRWVNDDMRRLALRAVEAAGGRMGAVDLVAKWRDGRMTDCRVVEINSAPALRSTTTLNAYVTALTPLLRQNNG